MCIIIHTDQSLAFNFYPQSMNTINIYYDNENNKNIKVNTLKLQCMYYMYNYTAGKLLLGN